MKLSQLNKRQQAVVMEVQDSEVAQKLLEFGILPGAPVFVVNRAPFNGPIYIRSDHSHIALRRSEAAFILVE